MSKKNKSFTKIWKSQTDIGKQFGLSAVAVGKLLITAGLRNPDTKLATPTAISDEWCVATPLKTGELHYMWNVAKISGLISQQGVKKLGKIELLANDMIKNIRTAEKHLDAGEDKIGYWALDAALDNIPENNRKEVATILKTKGYGKYVESW